MALPIPEKDVIEKLRERTEGTPYRFIGFVGENVALDTFNDEFRQLFGI